MGMEPVTTVHDTIGALGGISAIARLLGLRRASAVANWRVRGRIPPTYYPVIQEELARRGKCADASVFGMVQAESVAAFS